MQVFISGNKEVQLQQSNRNYMISKIKERVDKHGNHYTSCRVTGGDAKLEDAEDRFIWSMYARLYLGGRKQK